MSGRGPWMALLLINLLKDPADLVELFDRRALARGKVREVRREPYGLSLIDDRLALF
jgi:hypothetical protein